MNATNAYRKTPQAVSIMMLSRAFILKFVFVVFVGCAGEPIYYYPPHKLPVQNQDYKMCGAGTDYRAERDYLVIADSLRKPTRQERVDAVDFLIKTGQINSNPAHSCFKSLQSVNFINCTPRSEVEYLKYLGSNSRVIRKLSAEEVSEIANKAAPSDFDNEWTKRNEKDYPPWVTYRSCWRKIDGKEYRVSSFLLKEEGGSYD